MPSEPRRPSDSVVRADGWPDRRRPRLRHLALHSDRQPTGNSIVMKLSSAPTAHNPYGTRPVAAAGAGVQFATSPNGERSGVRRKGGLVAFDFHGAARLDMTGRCVAGHGSTSHPRHGWQFLRAGQYMSRMGPAVLGWARQHRNLRRYSGTIFRGRVHLGAARHGEAGHAKARQQRHLGR